MPRPIQVAISGAAGQISYALVFRVAAGVLFGHDQPVALRLLDVPDANDALDAVAMELFDCASPCWPASRSGPTRGRSSAGPTGSCCSAAGRGATRAKGGST